VLNIAFHKKDFSVEVHKDVKELRDASGRWGNDEYVVEFRDIQLDDVRVSIDDVFRVEICT
jgi:hypothetical protein